MKRLTLFFALAACAWGQYTPPAGGVPSGPAGGALNGSYPNPLVGKMGTPVPFVAIGDSIVSGPGADETTSFPHALAASLIVTYTNKGISGNRTDQIAARFAADVVALAPAFVIINGGVDNIAQASGNQASFIADWTSMLNASVAANIKPIVMLIAPWTGGTNGQMTTADAYNAALISLAATYPTAVVIDPRPYVGKFRSGGTAGNLWDINPVYLFIPDGQNIHFNIIGCYRLAQAFAAGLYLPGLYYGVPVDQYGRFTERVYIQATDDGTTPLQVGATVSTGFVSADIAGTINQRGNLFFFNNKLLRFYNTAGTDWAYIQNPGTSRNIAMSASAAGTTDWLLDSDGNLKGQASRQLWIQDSMISRMALNNGPGVNLHTVWGTPTAVWWGARIDTSANFNLDFTPDGSTWTQGPVFTNLAGGVGLTLGGPASASAYSTKANCSSAASPAVCAAASAGSAVIAAAATSVVVNTTAVTTNSQVIVTADSSLGAKLSVTCNTQSSLVVGSPSVTARVAATSFTIAVPVAPTTNPLCLSYQVIN